MRSLRPVSSFLLVPSMLCLAACTTTVLPPETEIDRETFVRAYVDLRLAALENGGSILPTTRDSILGAYGVEGESLVEFARVRGDDPEYMSEVWDEITARMDGDTLDVEAGGRSIGEDPPGGLGELVGDTADGAGRP
jgi:hypothetical protein